MSDNVTLNPGHSGAGNAAGVTANNGLDLRNPFVLSKIDDLLARQISCTLVATSFSGTSNLSTVCNWHEQTV